MDGSLRFRPPAPTDQPLRGRAAAKARTRAKILAAAKVLFARHAYATMTMRMLAQEAGFSTGAIFTSFKDKADVWRAAMECEPPLDGPIVRAAQEMQHALRGLIAIKPREAGGDFDPDQVAAWKAAETALALSEGRTA